MAAMQAAACRAPRAAVAEKRRAVATVQAARGAERRAVREAVCRAYAITRRTLRRWVAQARRGELGRVRCGRPRVAVPRAVRQGVIMLLAALGPGVGEKTVRAFYAQVPWEMIRTLKRRMKRALARRQARGRARLCWRRPGAVWAMDFTRPQARLEGGRLLLVIRDVATGFRLAAVPAASESSEVVCTTLRSLLATYGAPLVIKLDGGSGFKAHETLRLLAEAGVKVLRSPPRTPAYNGSIERDVGHLKERIEHLAWLEGRPGRWTLEDVERARVQANRTLRPWGANGPTPEEAFDRRRRVTDRERERFARRVQAHVRDRLQRHMDESGTLIEAPPIDSIERRAITHALCELGYLRIRRGR